MEQQGKEKNSTVAISPDVAKKLAGFCQAKGITKKDFISLSLSYFERYGINPAKHESPAEEIEKLRKRLDQVIAFIRTQEKDKINPMFEAITATEVRIKNDLDAIAKISHLKSLTDRLGEVFAGIAKGEETNNKKAIAESRKISDGLIMLAECLEGGKDRKGLTGAMRNLFGV